MNPITKTRQEIEKTKQQSLQQLANIRAKIEESDNEFYWLENAPFPLKDALAKIDGELETFSDPKGICKFFYQQEILGNSVFEAGLNIQNEVYSGLHISSGTVNVATILVPLLGVDSVREALYKMAERAAQNIDAGPPLAERAQLKADLKKRKYLLEVEEENLICTAEEIGLDGFYRRADCNPEIVLMEAL